jgi:peptidylprolyl isomerase
MLSKKLFFISLAVVLIGVGCSNKSDESNVFDNSQADNQSQEQEQQESDQDSQEQSAPSDESDQETSNQTNSMANQIATLKTSMGDIKVELFIQDAPITAGNFLKLAKEDYYDGITFHRVIPDFMIQGGDPLSKDDDPTNDGTGGPGYFIEDEFYEGSTNVRGTLSMANAGPGTGGSQFFINIKDNSFLDYDKEPLSSKHAVFGKVLEGMDIVDSISLVSKDGRDRPLENVVIQDIVVE